MNTCLHVSQAKLTEAVMRASLHLSRLQVECIRQMCLTPPARGGVMDTLVQLCLRNRYELGSQH